jgi:hypothetical protein
LFVRPDERPFLSADLIRHATWTATLPELIARVEALKEAGFAQTVFSVLPGQEHAVKDWVRTCGKNLIETPGNYLRCAAAFLSYFMSP